MKKFAKTIVTFALVTAATVSLGSVPAFAAENTAPFRKCDRPVFSASAGSGEVNWKPDEMRKFTGRKKGEMTEEEKAARIKNFKAMLAEKLASGEITQEKYDKITANMENGNFMFGKWGGSGMGGEKVKDFKPFKEGKPVQPGNFKTKLAEKIASGEITQEKSDNFITRADK